MCKQELRQNMFRPISFDVTVLKLSYACGIVLVHDGRCVLPFGHPTIDSNVLGHGPQPDTLTAGLMDGQYLGMIG